MLSCYKFIGFYLINRNEEIMLYMQEKTALVEETRKTGKGNVFCVEILKFF